MTTDTLSNDSHVANNKCYEVNAFDECVDVHEFYVIDHFYVVTHSMWVKSFMWLMD